MILTKKSRNVRLMDIKSKAVTNGNKIKMVSDFPDMIGIKHICQALGLCSRTVYLLLKNKKIPGFMIGRVWMVRKEDLKIYMDSYIEPEHTPEIEGDLHDYYEDEFADYPDILFTDQIEKMLNVSNNYVVKRLKDGRIKSFLFGRNYRTPKQFVIDYAVTEDHQSDRRRFPHIK